MTIRVNDVEGVGGFVLPGDRVDVALTRQIDKTSATTEVVLQGAKVLAVDQSADERATKASVPKSVTLEVDTLEAQKLSLAATVGNLSLLLRQGRRYKRREDAQDHAQGSRRARRCRRTERHDSATVVVTRASKAQEYSVPVEHQSEAMALTGRGRSCARMTPAGNSRENIVTDMSSSAGLGRMRALAVAVAIALAASLLGVASGAHAQQRSIQIAGASRTAMVLVTVGKSQDVRTDASFVDITRRRSGGRRRQSAHRSYAVDSRQENRHDAGVGLCRGQEAGRHFRRRGVL